VWVEASVSETKKRKKPAPLTQRTLRALRVDGWMVQVVEKWIPAPSHPAGGVRKDLWGFGDVLAIKGDVTLLVQTCRAADVATRLAKIRETTVRIGDGDDAREDLALPLVLRAGWRVEIHGWAKPTKTLRRWRQRVVVVGLEDEYEARPERAA
jgi:hypothetical protein